MSVVTVAKIKSGRRARHERVPEEGWLVRLATLQKTSSYVCFVYRSPRHNSSLPLPLARRRVGRVSSSFFPFDSRVNVSLNPRSSYNEPLRIGNTRFSQTCLHSHSRTHEQSKIFVPDFAPPYPLRGHSFARAERRKEGRREKRQRERRRGSEIKR